MATGATPNGSGSPPEHRTGTADHPGPGPGTVVTLSGPDRRWWAAEATEDLRRTFTDPGEVPGDWEPVPVPGHWRSVPAFAASDGPVLYRTRFEVDRPGEGERLWLVLEGAFYQCDVFVDGSYLTDTEGYFVPHAAEITGACRDRTEHLLAVEVACERPQDLRAKRTLTGVFSHWDMIDPDWNPGGIWRPVRIVRTGPVRISRCSLRCASATPERAVVAVRATFDAAVGGPATVVTRVADTEHRVDLVLAEGTNERSWQVVVDRPRLWWPRALGSPELVDASVAVETPGGPSDERRFRTGLRQVRMRGWVLQVNSERLFCKGANLAPTRRDPASATPEEVRADVVAAGEVGLDLLRVHAHIARPEVYEAADETGMLLWQDMPLQWAYARSVRAQAVRQAAAAVDLLGHHPSIALWCGHNEPLPVERTDIDPADRKRLAATVARLALATELPTWNRTVLDRSIRRSLERSDGTRPVIAHSGMWPHPPDFTVGDTHLYFGWYHGEADDLPRAAAAWPNLVRFVSEFGAQAVPHSAEFMEPGRWPELDWEHLVAHHGLQKAIFDRRVPPDRHPDFASWRDATQAYQAEVVGRTVEHLRRLKYRPAGGFCVFVLNDCQPAVSWSLLDHRRVPKAAWETLRDVCRPVIVVADRMPRAVRPGQRLELDVHVVSDLRRDLAGITVTAELSGGGLAGRWAWKGDVPADSVVRVGRVGFEAPRRGGSGVRLSVRAEGDGLRVGWSDRTTVTEAP